MNLSTYLFDGKQTYKADQINPADSSPLRDKTAGKQLLAQNQALLQEMQPALYAQGEQALLVIFQAMDAAGKDGTIKHVFSGVNPQGIQVSNFKQPSSTELAHDFLWRAHMAVPRRGMIGIFNRSHYEDVLIGKVLDLPMDQPLPASSRKNLWPNRYRQIRDFERMLYENGTTILKFYLHLSPQEQAARFLSRMDDPAKRWKFSVGDLNTRGYWDDYMRAYESAINETAASHAPWYVVPADHKWFARALVSEVVASTLAKMKPAFPTLPQEELLEMENYRHSLDHTEKTGKESADAQ